MCFLGSVLSITVLELLYKTFKVCVKQLLKALVYVIVTRFTFTKFARVNIFMHWHVISITCKMTCEQLASNMEKSMDNT